MAFLWCICLGFPFLSAADDPAAPSATSARYEGKTSREWLQALRDVNPVIRRRAVEALEAMHVAPADVLPEALRLLQRDQDPDVRAAVSAALGDWVWHEGSVVPALTKALQDKDLRVRANSALNLVRVGKAARPALPALRAALKDPAACVRVAAAVALWEIDRQAEPAVLIDALGSSIEDIRVRAAAGLGDMGAAAAGANGPLRTALQDQTSTVRLWTARALWKTQKDTVAVVPALVDLLRDANAAVRVDAAWNLTEIGPAARGALGSLTEALQDPEPKVRALSALALWKIDRQIEAVAPAVVDAWVRRAPPDALRWHTQRFGIVDFFRATGKASVPALIAKLSANDAYTRRLAANGLTLIGAEARAAIPGLTALLKDSDVEVRREAARALAKMGPEGRAAVPLLIQDLKRRGPQGLPFLYDATVALEEIGAPAKEAVDPLLDVLTTGDPWLHTYAIHTLGRIGPEARAAVTPLHRRLNDKNVFVRVEAAGALWRIDPRQEGVLPVLIAALDDPKGFAAAAEALAEIGTAARPAVPSLVRMLKDTDERWSAGANALGRLGIPAPEALPLLKPKLRHASGRFRVLAAKALARLDRVDERILEVLKTSLRDQDGTVRYQAAEAMGIIGAPARPCLPALACALWDASDDVRKAAADALKRIDPQAAAKLGLR